MKQVPALLSFIGEKTYSLLGTKILAQLTAILSQHLSTKLLVIVERFRFHKRDQQEKV